VGSWWVVLGSWIHVILIARLRPSRFSLLLLLLLLVGARSPGAARGGGSGEAKEAKVLQEVGDQKLVEMRCG
jgi:hypothetical protein